MYFPALNLQPAVFSLLWRTRMPEYSRYSSINVRLLNRKKEDRFIGGRKRGVGESI
jgi:hypothetical protein